MAGNAAVLIASAPATNPSRAAPRPSTNISAARSTASTPDTDCGCQSAELPGLSSPFCPTRPTLRIRCLPCRMPRMLQPAGVSARPASINPASLNCTLRSPDPRPAPIKPPERCPHCNSPRLIKKGARQKKLERVPLYRCRACGRTFTPGPRAVRNKTYPINEILEALTQYDRGSTLEETSRTISSRHGHPVAPSTISRWLSEHPALTTYRRLRARGRRLFTPPQVIRAHKLYHRQVYEFAIHRAKLAFLRDGSLDEKRSATPARRAVSITPRVSTFLSTSNNS